MVSGDLPQTFSINWKARGPTELQRDKTKMRFSVHQHKSENYLSKQAIDSLSSTARSDNKGHTDLHVKIVLKHSFILHRCVSQNFLSEPKTIHVLMVN